MNHSIAYIVDHASDIDEEILEQHQVYSLPFGINFSHGHYITGESIDRESLFEKMKEEIPTSSVCSLDRFDRILERIKERKIKNVLVITMGHKFSSFHNFLKLYAQEKKDFNIYVFDSNAVSFAEGAYLVRALDLEGQGYSFEEICQGLEEMKDQDCVQVRAYFGSLDNLIRGGRMKKTTGAIANALNIRPIVELSEGLMGVREKIRGEKRAYRYLLEEVKKSIDPEKKYYLSLLYGQGEKEKAKLEEVFKEEIAQADYYQMVPLSPVVLVHSGPRVAGVVWACFDEEKGSSF